MATVSELRQQAKARKIPKYSRMNKSQLMGALGVTNQSARPLGDARARSTAKQHGIAKTYAADKLSSKLGGSDEAKRVAIKQRIVKSVSKELKAHEKKIGRKLTIEEKRSVAVKALASEVRAIRSGKLSSDEIRTARTANIKRLQEEGKLPPSELSKDEIRTAREANLKRLQKEKAKPKTSEPEVKSSNGRQVDQKKWGYVGDSDFADLADMPGLSGKTELGVAARTPSKFIKHTGETTPDHSKAVLDQMGSKNVDPVYVHKTKTDSYKVLHNGHISDAAKNGKRDFVQTIVVGKAQHAALEAEKAVHSRVLDPSKVSKSAHEVESRATAKVSSTAATKAFHLNSVDYGFETGTVKKILAKHVDSKANSGATPEQLKAISDHMKKNGRNIMPVFVRKTGEDKYEAVHNGHILEAAKKGKHDFVHTILLDEKMHKQLQAEQKH